MLRLETHLRQGSEVSELLMDIVASGCRCSDFEQVPDLMVVASFLNASFTCILKSINTPKRSRDGLHAAGAQLEGCCVIPCRALNRQVQFGAGEEQAVLVLPVVALQYRSSWMDLHCNATLFLSPKAVVLVVS